MGAASPDTVALVRFVLVDERLLTSFADARQDADEPDLSDVIGR